ncbi:hypothetical protein E2C01_072816 [Portunus trituberculatus]|uniref:Uncharacterized protein n=1 Tax=Portunus trituberculatus TaxID=210409 RepID=A0A5B7I3L0_PORTR|nr:hypothetical protein [Portunus trituberculatus]
MKRDSSTPTSPCGKATCRACGGREQGHFTTEDENEVRVSKASHWWKSVKSGRCLCLLTGGVSWQDLSQLGIGTVYLEGGGVELHLQESHELVT